MCVKRGCGRCIYRCVKSCSWPKRSAELSWVCSVDEVSEVRRNAQLQEGTSVARLVESNGSCVETQPPANGCLHQIQTFVFVQS